jgi:hypothetical protein
MEPKAEIEIQDGRTCRTHGTVISSPDGMFDGLCGLCEAEMDRPGPFPNPMDEPEPGPLDQAEIPF